MTPSPAAWTASAACAAADPAAFFPERGGRTAAAKKICAQCPVTLLCLTAALDGPELYGIWGGLGERERRRLQRRKAAASAA